MREDKVIEDWIDADEVRSLARKLMSPSQAPAPAPDDPAYGDGFEGFALPEVEPVGETISPVAPIQPVAGEITPVEEVTTQENPFQKKAPGPGLKKGAAEPKAPASPFQAAKPEAARSSASRVSSPPSLQSFVAWLGGEIPLESCLVSRVKGAVLFDSLRNPKLASVAGLLAGAGHQKGGETLPAMVVKLGPRKVMQVICYRHSGERCYAALVLPRPLADTGVQAFLKALIKAL
ncbi:MAG: hypothetical protein PVJ98_00425 [Akkermansiaceae bacterium]|jgi:hypothetical protein